MSTRLAPEQVKDLFDCVDGELLWRETRGPRARKGHPAGTVRAGGNVSILIGKRLYQRSRLVFAWHFGRWPEGELRHIDGNRGNDRISNLQDLPIHALRHLVKGTTHLPGTHLQDGRWIASITAKGTAVYLGSYGTEIEAHSAFAAAHAALYGDASPYAKQYKSPAALPGNDKELAGNIRNNREHDYMLGGYDNVANPC